MKKIDTEIAWYPKGYTDVGAQKGIWSIEGFDIRIMNDPFDLLLKTTLRDYITYGDEED